MKAIEEIQSGKMILAVADPGRETEGDLIWAAQSTRPELINFMVLKAKGVIGMPMSKVMTAKLNLPLWNWSTDQENRSKLE